MKTRQLVPCMVTMCAMMCGFLSILLTFEGMRQSRPEFYRWAAQLIMLAMILDGLDGNLARWLKGSSEFGAELDTYVDMTAFGIAPAILIFAVVMGNRDPIWRVVLPSAVAVSGVVRLARFKASDPLRGQAGYAGLPITANAGWVAVLVFISTVPPRDGSPQSDIFSLQHGWFATLFLVGVVTFIVLQVTNLRYPKPTKKASLFAICIVLVILLIALDVHSAVPVAVIMLVLGTGYVIIGPVFVKGVEIHKARRAARDDLLQEGGTAGAGDN